MRADKIVKGGKRALKGSVAPSKKTSSTQIKDKTPIGVEDNDLLANIRALGGDEEDYKIVKDVDSDDVQEFEDKVPNAKTAKDIASFLKSLNFKDISNIVSDEEHESSNPILSSLKEKQSSNTAVVESEGSSSNAVKKQLVAARMNIPASARWYNADYILTSSDSLPAVPQSVLASLRAKAESLHASLPPPPSTSKSDEQFISNVLASGTLSDRLSALTLMAQSSPIHNTRALESLKTMASKKGREESLKALRAIVDWWVGGGAPDHKLKYFADQPLNHPDVTDSHLTLWYFEDWLKKYFFSVLQLLEALSLDLLPYVRTQAMALIFQLLDAKPEQEQNLLRLLVNKLGDSEKTVASKASYQLLQILQHHPGMKAVIIRDVSSLILRPPARPSKPEPVNSQSSNRNTNQHSRYYGIITLNQITLSSSDAQSVAGSLVDLYFKLFREILNETTVNPNPAIPTNQSDKDVGKVGGNAKKQPRGDDHRRDRKEKGKMRGKINGKATSTTEFNEVEDTDSKTISAILAGVNRAFPFAKMEGSIFDEHIDTLFRITHTATFNVSIQALVLIFQVTSSKKTVSDRFYRTLYESIIDPRLINSSKQAMWLNLTFKSIKADTSHSRVCAFVKRTLQALGMHQPPFICGALYMLGQLLDSTPRLRDMMHVPEDTAKKPIVSTNSSPSTKEPQHSETYDPRKREPQYAHAETTCLWELIPLLNHFHPSVSLHARQILTSAQVTATADLGLNTLSHFLDRFVYKNPKKPKPRGASAMQPMAAAHDETGMVRLVRGVGEPGTGTVNEERFWQKPVAEVPVDQLFFHKFFLNKIDKQNERAKKVAKRKKGGADDSDDNEGASAGDAPSQNEPDSEEGESDDAEEAEIWKAMKQTMPGPRADLDEMDEGSDDIPSGLDSDSDNDSDGDSVSGDNGDDTEGEHSGSELHEDEAEGSDFAEDDLDLIDLEDEAPADIPLTSAFEPEDSEHVTGKRKPHAEDIQKGGRKRRKLGQLPTFASYEDYAKLIEEGPEDDI